MNMQVYIIACQSTTTNPQLNEIEEQLEKMGIEVLQKIKSIKTFIVASVPENVSLIERFAHVATVTKSVSLTRAHYGV